MDYATLKAPYLRYEQIRLSADSFLNEYHLSGEIPVPIEEIVEFDLGISIDTFPNLQTDFDTVGITAKSFQRIYIDEYVYNNIEVRARFTIAHEVGHVILHRKLFDEINVDSPDDFFDLISQIDGNQYRWFERHADDFAGLILVPKAPLQEKFEHAVSMYCDIEGFSIESLHNSHKAIEYISTFIARDFEVSAKTVEIRLRKDNLI